MKPQTSGRSILLIGLLFVSVFLKIASAGELPVTVPTEPWLVLQSKPNERIIGYMREDLASVDYVRMVGQEICVTVGDEVCTVSFWSDYELARKVDGASNWTEEMMIKRLARFRRYDVAESVMIHCPKDTIVIVSGKSFCHPETGYWPLFPSEE